MLASFFPSKFCRIRFCCNKLDWFQVIIVSFILKLEFNHVFAIVIIVINVVEFFSAPLWSENNSKFVLSNFFIFVEPGQAFVNIKRYRDSILDEIKDRSRRNMWPSRHRNHSESSIARIWDIAIKNVEHPFGVILIPAFPVGLRQEIALTAYQCRGSENNKQEIRTFEVHVHTPLLTIITTTVTNVSPSIIKIDLVIINILLRKYHWFHMICFENSK